MILDLREFSEFPAETVLSAQVGDFQPFAENVIAVDKVEVSLSIQHAGSEYFCQGTVNSQYQVECSRCLQVTKNSIEQKIDFIVCDKEVVENRRSETIDNEDYVFLFGNDLRADIKEPVKQALILSISMKPLCSEDCKGLCQSCGQNLNEKDCSCDKLNIDPRWDGLKKLIQSDN